MLLMCLLFIVRPIELARKSRIFTQKPFYGLFGLGTYTWKPYKVCWCGLGFNAKHR